MKSKETEKNVDASFAHSDLALERTGAECAAEASEEELCGCTVSRLRVTDRQDGKGEARYVTLMCGRIWEMDDERLDEVGGLIADELVSAVRRICRKELDRDFCVLVAGLGNDEITSDAIGPETVRRVEVTRHIRTYLPGTYKGLGVCSVSAIAPGVLGRTGIETVELIRAAAERVKPDIIIAIDALASRSMDRLAATVQISDRGIDPGSGIGNHRRPICRDSVGFPVISVGVPTVVDSATLIYDTMQRAGSDRLRPELVEVIEQGRDFFVSPKESDVILKKVACLLSRSIDKAFCSGIVGES